MKISIEIKNNKVNYSVDLHDECNLHQTRDIGFEDVTFFNDVMEATLKAINEYSCNIKEVRG